MRIVLRYFLTVSQGQGLLRASNISNIQQSEKGAGQP